MMTSNEGSSCSSKLCLKSWECCHDRSPSPPLSSATTKSSEELDQLGNDWSVPSEGSNAPKDMVRRGQGTFTALIMKLLTCTSRKLCRRLAWLQEPADFPRLEGLAVGHNGNRLYLQSCWSKVKLPSDPSNNRAFCSGYICLKQTNKQSEPTTRCTFYVLFFTHILTN